MKIEIISIGDELLIGQTINTNAAWMGEELSKMGAGIEYCTVIRDEKESMVNAFDLALSRVDVVLVTGGLGPTKDDITKHVLCDYFDTELEMNPEVLAHVKSFFEARNRPMLEVNVRQAEIPVACEVLHNELGTAPGMWFEKNGKLLVSMPGVPYEMKYIMTTHVLPRLLQTYSLNSLYYETVLTQGIGESFLADRISDLEIAMRSEGIALAYLPSPGLVRLRLSSPHQPHFVKKIESYITEIEHLLPAHVFGRGEGQLSEVVGELLLERKQTLCTAESCTGGALAASIVSIAGASYYFEGSVVSYSNRVKTEVLKVSEKDIKEVGAVSQTVVEQMARNAKEVLKTDYCIALSGIAGPAGDYETKPVGLTWIAVAGPHRVVTKKFQFGTDRQRNIQMAVLSGLNLLRCEILEINIEKS